MKVRVPPRLLLFPSFRNVSESLSRSPPNLSTINTPERPGDQKKSSARRFDRSKKNCKQPSQARSRNSLSLDFPSLAGGAFEPAERLEHVGKVPLHLGAQAEDGLCGNSGLPSGARQGAQRCHMAQPRCCKASLHKALDTLDTFTASPKSPTGPTVEAEAATGAIRSHTQPYAAIRSHAPPCALHLAPFEAARAGDPAGTTASARAGFRVLFLNSFYLALPSTSM